MRALLGVSVGLIMPLSTGLLSYFYPPEEQARLMGLSAAMNQMGGVVGTLLAGVLASIEWNYAFLVYIFGLVALFMVIRWLPNEKLGSSNKRGKPFEPRQLLKFHPSVIGMLLLTMVFFVFPTNFAIITGKQYGNDTYRFGLHRTCKWSGRAIFYDDCVHQRRQEYSRLQKSSLAPMRLWAM